MLPRFFATLWMTNGRLLDVTEILRRYAPLDDNTDCVIQSVVKRSEESRYHKVGVTEILRRYAPLDDK